MVPRSCIRIFHSCPRETLPILYWAAGQSPRQGHFPEFNRQGLQNTPPPAGAGVGLSGGTAFDLENSHDGFWATPTPSASSEQVSETGLVHNASSEQVSQTGPLGEVSSENLRLSVTELPPNSSQADLHADIRLTPMPPLSQNSPQEVLSPNFFQKFFSSALFVWNQGVPRKTQN